MDTSTCTTIVLVLLWLYLCCQALGTLVAHIDDYNTNELLYGTATLSTVLLAICLWQCKKAGYLVSPMTWYHWVLLVLLVILQVMAVVMEQQGWDIWRATSTNATHPIYGIAVVILAILGGTLYCGWKCNLFCRPCCKSQYICYGSAILVVLVILTVLAVTALLAKSVGANGLGVYILGLINGGETEKTIIQYLGNLAVPCTQIYSTAVLWNTTLKLPYTVLEVIALIASALAVASLLAMGVLGCTSLSGVKHSAKGYPFLALHLIALVITLYCLEYKNVFYWPKDYMCLGVLIAVVILVALVVVVLQIVDPNGLSDEAVKFTLLGYSIILMLPTLWYAYRCGLLTWRWISCVPKKRGLKAPDTAENTVTDSDIAKES